MTCTKCKKEIVKGVCGCGKRDIRDIGKLGMQFRTFALERSSVDEEKRTVPLCFSSEAPVERWWGYEILDHSPGSVRMDRLRANAAVLVDHNPREQVGVVESPVIGADRKGRADARFSRANPRAEQEYQDVLDEIRTQVSCGYMIHAMVLEKEEDGVCTYRVTDWEPYEISTVSIAADVVNAGIGRDKTTWEEMEIAITVKTSEVTQETEPCCEACGCTPCSCSEDTEGSETAASNSDPNNSPTEERNMSVEVKEAVEQARSAEQHRVREIMAIAEKHPALAEAAREFINSDKTLDEFRAVALERVANATPVNVSPEIGMNDKERREFSITRAMHLMANYQPLDGLEREASEAVAKLIKREAKGFYIPHDVMVTPFQRSLEQVQRSLNAGTATAGGFTVNQQLMIADMIELLRNKPMLARMGCRTITGLVGNIAIPRVTGGATAYWLPETGGVTPSDQSFGQLGLTPHRLVGDTAYSKELLMQSSLDVEGFVREDLMTVLAIEKDRAGVNGLGANGEPLGILNTTGIGSVTFGGSATWGKAVSFETQVANANADVGPMGYLTTPNVRGSWKTTPKVTNQAFFIWEGGDQPGSGRVNGYRAEATKQVPGDKVIFGNWQDLIMAEWSGIDVVVDPYSQKKNGLVEVTTTLWCDMGLRHPGSFCVSTDGGNQ